MNTSRSFSAAAVAAVALALPFGNAQAIVTATGALPALPPGLSLAGVGQLQNGCSSVLLAGGLYVLASAHCAAAVGSTVSFNGGAVTATVEQTFFAPGFAGVETQNDLTLSRLVVPVVGVQGYARAATPTLPGFVVLAGYGAGGTGLTGASQPGGVLRWGFNDYEALLPDDPNGSPPAIYNGTVVSFDFDDGTAATSHFGSLGRGDAEAGVAGGDSGGPSFMLVAGQWQVAGIHVAVADDLGFGYGAIGYDMLVGRYAGWIDQVTAVPEPATAPLWLAGAVAVFAWARRAGRAGAAVKPPVA